MINILKHCGNFSESVLQGMIAYGEEKEQGRGKVGTLEKDFPKEGYATKEGDITLGGFLYIAGAKEAVQSGKKLSAMSVAEKKALAYKVAARHMAKYGLVGNEFHRHWLERVQKFAGHNNLKLPEQGNSETTYEYSRRLREWTLSQPRKWPEMQKAAGTHLVLSPEPKLWTALRAGGVEERSFLKKVLQETMKDFADWRRQIHGPGRGIGWVAGTHIHADGAEEHPHIHLIVLKRDENGKEVDMSVTRLKGRKSNRADPDPIETLKARFTKNMAREFERATGLKPEQVPGAQRQPGQEPQDSSKPNQWSPFPSSFIPRPKLRRFGKGLRVASRIMRPYFPRNSFGGDLGAMLRIMGAVQQLRRPTSPLPSLRIFQDKVRHQINPGHEGPEPGD